MDTLKCSICGFESKRKKFQYDDINEHFDNAIEVWCPTKKCQETYPERRVVPPGCKKNWWHEYEGFYTIEKAPKIIELESVRSIARAKMIRDIGLQMILSQTNPTNSVNKEKALPEKK